MLDFRYAYIDDLLIASGSQEEHKHHLHLVLECLNAHGIIIPQKCDFGVSNLNFLGYLVDLWGIHPLEEKVQVIHVFPEPTTRRKLREFLGLVNFYHCFVPHCADILLPLNSLLFTPKITLKLCIGVIRPLQLLTVSRMLWLTPLSFLIPCLMP